MGQPMAGVIARGNPCGCDRAVIARGPRAGPCGVPRSRGEPSPWGVAGNGSGPLTGSHDRAGLDRAGEGSAVIARGSIARGSIARGSGSAVIAPTRLDDPNAGGEAGLSLELAGPKSSIRRIEGLGLDEPKSSTSTNRTPAFAWSNGVKLGDSASDSAESIRSIIFGDSASDSAETLDRVTGHALS